MWKSIKKGLSLVGQSLGVVVLIEFAFTVFCVIMPTFTGWEAFLWGLGGFVLLFAAFLGIWALGEENKK